MGKLRQKLEAGELEPQHGPWAGGCGGLGGDGLDSRGEQAALAAQTPAAGAPREVWGGATCLAAVRGGIGGYLKASAAPSAPPHPATFLDMGGGWPIAPSLEAGTSPPSSLLGICPSRTRSPC